MTNQFDYRYRWRFTRRALCLFDADKLVGELVRLGCELREADGVTAR